MAQSPTSIVQFDTGIKNAVFSDTNFPATELIAEKPWAGTVLI
jgi:hypothetical protein